MRGDQGEKRRIASGMSIANWRGEELLLQRSMTTSYTASLVSITTHSKGHECGVPGEKTCRQRGMKEYYEMKCDYVNYFEVMWINFKLYVRISSPLTAGRLGSPYNHNGERQDKEMDTKPNS